MDRDDPTYRRNARGTPDEVLGRLEAELKRRGFGVLSTIRVHDVLREKLGASVAPVILLDVCSPRHALAALSSSRDVAPLLPCKLVVSEEGGPTQVTLQRPTIVLGAFLPLPALRGLGIEVEAELRAAVDAVAGS